MRSTPPANSGSRWLRRKKVRCVKPSSSMISAMERGTLQNVTIFHPTSPSSVDTGAWSVTKLPDFRSAWSVTKLPDGPACAVDKSAGSEPACAVEKSPDDPMGCAVDKPSCPDRTWPVTNFSDSSPAWSVTKLPDFRPAWSVTKLPGSRTAWSVTKPDAPAPTGSSARSVRPSRSTRCSARTNTGVSVPSNGDIRVRIASRSRTASAPAPERPVTARTSRGCNLPWRQAKAKVLASASSR